MERTLTLEQYAKDRSRRIGFFKKYGTVLLFALPFLLAFCIFFIYPLFYGIYISLSNFKYSAPGESVLNDFKWYRMIFDPASLPTDALIRSGSLVSESFWRSFMHSFVFAVIMVPIAIIVPLVLAILVNNKPPLFKLFRCLIYMPSIIPLTAAGTIFALFFLPASQHGLFATIFPGVGPKDWFTDIWFSFGPLDANGNAMFQVAWGWIPVFLMCFWGGWGGNFIILSAGLQNVPKSLYEAASIDGCSSWEKSKSVTIPGIKPQLVLCLFTTIIGYLGLYGQNYVLTSGGPINSKISSLPGGGRTSTVIYFIQDIVANNTNFKAKLYGLAAAASIIYALIVGIISAIQMFATRDKKSGTKISEDFETWKRAKNSL